MANKNLTSAKKARNDEFYTQYEDIQKEVQAYIDYNPDIFRDKVVYLNCDDPYESNFFKFFANKFNKYGIKKLIATSYFNSPVAETELQVSLFPEIPAKEIKPKTGVASSAQTKTTTENGETKGRVIEITEVHDENGDGVFDLEDIKKIIQANGGGELLNGDNVYPPGDFRSDECVELLKQADIVVTNPPFSLFREYVAQLFEHDKKFLIIGNMNAITYKEVFPRIRRNEIWLGATRNGVGSMWFQIPESMPKKTGQKYDENGKRFQTVGSSAWFTSLDHGKRHQKLQLMTMAENKKFNKKVINSDTCYKKYDNYDAIEVSFVDTIPSDYDGVMGVPITFLGKYNPDQFEILGATESEGKGFSDGLWDEKSGISQPVIERESLRESLSDIRIPNQDKYDRPYVDGKRLYFRILIKHKKGAKK